MKINEEKKRFYLRFKQDTKLRSILMKFSEISMAYLYNEGEAEYLAFILKRPPRVS